MRALPRCLGLLSLLTLAAACAGDPEQNPTDIALGETALVVWVNPQVNEQNSASVPGPGERRGGVVVSVEGGPEVVADARGIAVLTGVSAGRQHLRFSGSEGTLAVEVREGDLRELAVSVDGSSARLMSDVAYPFGAQVTEVNAQMTAAEVSAALNASDRIVLFRGGTYTGDLVVNGSNVTLFGEGPAGGRVTIRGNVVAKGSALRIRGARVEGNLSLDGSGGGLSFSDVRGSLTSNGSDKVLLGNVLCGATSLTGGNLTLLQNAGLPPLAAQGC